MGCFLGCFGKSKTGKRRRHGQKVLPREKRNKSCKPGSSSVPLKEETANLDNVVSPVPELKVRYKPEKQSNFNAKKKVTFDSHVEMYEAVLPGDDADFQLESDIGGKKEKLSANSNQSFEDSNVTSSTGSYPSNRRYQNCRDSDISDDDVCDLGEELEDLYVDAEDGTVDSSIRRATSAQSDDATVACDLNDEEVNPICSNKNARNRSLHVHPVMNPVENVTQSKAVKAKSRTQLGSQKENLALCQDPLVSSSSEPSFKYPPLSLKSICEAA